MKKKTPIITIVAISILFVLTSIMFSACKPKTTGSYFTDHVLVFVKEEYNGKFDAEEFTLEDFNFYNIKSFCYYHYFASSTNNEMRFIVIWLIETGKQYVNEAVSQLSKLEFVEHAELSYQPHTEDGYVGYLFPN